MIGAVLAVFAVAIVDNRDDAPRGRDRALQGRGRGHRLRHQRHLRRGRRRRPLRTTPSASAAAEVDQKALDALKKQSQLTYVVILDAQGNVIASTQGVDESITRADRRATVARRQRPRGRSRGTCRRHHSAATSPSTRPASRASEGQRVLVQGFPIELISGLLGGTLASLPNAERSRPTSPTATAASCGADEKSVKPGCTRAQARRRPRGDPRPGRQHRLAASC